MTISGSLFARGILVAISLTLWPAAVHATSWHLERTFDDPTVTRQDNFGYSVALDGNNVLIGAPLDSTRGFWVGQAHLFDGGSGALLRTFDDPTVTEQDGFGRSVALGGNQVLIGAPSDDSRGLNVGQAHLFDAGSGALLRTFDDPTPTGNDAFGASIALAGDYVLIGAPGDDTQGVNVGQAHLFDAGSGALLRTFNDPTLTSHDAFGISTALDGNHVLVGASGDWTQGPSVGQAHLFDAGSGALLRTFDDPTPTESDQFGWPVAIDGDYVLVGAPTDDTNGNEAGQAYLFDTRTGALLRTFNGPRPDNEDLFGNAVALDGTRALIGSWLAPPGGQVHLFDVTTGTLLQTFDNPSETWSEQFGWSVALDGDNVLIGEPFDQTTGRIVGQAHLFTPAPVVIPAPAALPLFLSALLVLAAASRMHRESRHLDGLDRHVAESRSITASRRGCCTYICERRNHTRETGRSMHDQALLVAAPL